MTSAPAVISAIVSSSIWLLVVRHLTKKVDAAEAEVERIVDQVVAADGLTIVANRQIHIDEGADAVDAFLFHSVASGSHIDGSVTLGDESALYGCIVEGPVRSIGHNIDVHGCILDPGGNVEMSPDGPIAYVVKSAAADANGDQQDS